MERVYIGIKSNTKIGLWYLLNILDTVTTILLMDLGCIEANIICGKLITLGIGYFISYKIIITLLVPLILMQIKKDRLLKILNILFGLVVTWNIILLIIMN
jgi:hypothetical protein